MNRATDQRLEELKNSGVPIYSISRLDCINRCLAEAYETYRKNNRGNGNIYTLCGSKVHEILEGIVNGENTESDLYPAVLSELEDAEMLGYAFPKMADGSDGIRDKWIKDMTHFCNTYKSPNPKNLTTEELFIYKSPDGNVLQGYIDLQRRNDDGSIDIYDYKTSSLYSGESIKEHGRQLVVYQMGLEQAGETVRNVSWIFLKYAEIKFIGKKTVKSKEKTEISKVVERCKIGSEMAKYAEQMMIDAGYDEVDIDVALTDFKLSNSFNTLPEDIAKQFKLLPYVMKYEVTDEVKKECEEYIDSTIAKWEALGEDENNYKPLNFTKIQKNGKEVLEIFYCTTLCSHGKTCKYLHDFLDKYDANKTEDEFDNLF